MSLGFTLGTVLITGPKAGEFCSAFCNHKATLLKADGKDILSVTFQKRESLKTHQDSILARFTSGPLFIDHRENP